MLPQIGRRPKSDLPQRHFFLHYAAADQLYCPAQLQPNGLKPQLKLHCVFAVLFVIVLFYARNF